MSKAIYLGKNGETFGPFTESDVNDLRASGKIAEYSWIKQEGDESWRPIDAPPPDPSASARKAEPETQKTAAKPKRKSASRSLPKGIQAICHNNNRIMSGTIHDVSDDGCFFVASAQTSAPTMGTQAIVILNLLDEKTGRSVNVKAQILDAKKENLRWSYKIHWEDCPTI